MEVDKRKFRIVSGPPEIAETLVNELWKDFTLLTVNIQPIDGRPWITAVLIHRSEIPGPAQIALPVGRGFHK